MVFHQNQIIIDEKLKELTDSGKFKEIKDDEKDGEEGEKLQE
jgi:hypothetical protein